MFSCRDSLNRNSFRCARNRCVLVIGVVLEPVVFVVVLIVIMGVIPFVAGGL